MSQLSNRKNRLLIIGPLPPPDMGQAYAVETLVQARQLHNLFDVKVLDSNITGRKLPTAMFRILRLFLSYFFFLFIFHPNIVYLTLGQTTKGILRDSLLILSSYLLRIKVIGHLHGGGLQARYRNSSAFLRFLMRTSIGKLSVGIVLGKSLVNQFHSMLSSERVKVVNVTYWGAESSSISLSLATTRRRCAYLNLLFLSNVFPSKGIFDCLAALSFLRRRDVPFKFVLAGACMPEDGYTAQFINRRIRTFIVDHELENSVVVYGRASGDEKWKLFQDADVFLLPTFFALEGQPASILEAMYAGCAVIATRYRGIPDLLEDGENGLFVPARSPETIAQRIEWIWRHPEWLQETCKRNHLKVVQQFSPERYLKNMIHVFYEILNN